MDKLAEFQMNYQLIIFHFQGGFFINNPVKLIH